MIFCEHYREIDTSTVYLAGDVVRGAGGGAEEREHHAHQVAAVPRPRAGRAAGGRGHVTKYGHVTRRGPVTGGGGVNKHLLLQHRVRLLPLLVPEDELGLDHAGDAQVEQQPAGAAPAPHSVPQQHSADRHRVTAAHIITIRCNT